MLWRIQNMPVAPVPLPIKRLLDTPAKVDGRKGPTRRYTPVQAVSAAVDKYVSLSSPSKKAERKTVYTKQLQDSFAAYHLTYGTPNKNIEAKKLFSYVAATWGDPPAFNSLGWARLVNTLYMKMGEFMYEDGLDGISEEFEFMFGRNSPHSLLHLVTPESHAKFNEFKAEVKN